MIKDILKIVIVDAVVAATKEIMDKIRGNSQDDKSNDKSKEEKEKI